VVPPRQRGCWGAVQETEHNPIPRRRPFGTSMPRAARPICFAAHLKYVEAAAAARAPVAPVKCPQAGPLQTCFAALSIKGPMHSWATGC